MDTIASLSSAIPFRREERFRAVEIAAAGDAFARAFAEAFPMASLLSLEQTAGAPPIPVQREREPGARIRRPYDIATVDWWDALFGAALVVAPNGLSTLNDAKRQYVFKAAADRMAVPGALLVADALPPGTLLHHLIWLKHAGLAVVDCFARDGETAVFGGYRR